MTGKRKASTEKLLDGFGDDEVQGLNEVDTTPKNQVDVGAPDRFSPEWSDYALSLFADDEKFNERPKANGLRRVAQLLLGRIVSSTPDNVFPPTERSRNAAVVWRLEFANGDVFGDVADCNEDNTDDAFVAFAFATAATRAEARALRKALGIATASAEEMTTKDTAALVRSAAPSAKSSTGEIADADRMSDPQRNLIDIKCKQLDIDPVKFFRECFKINANGKITKKQASPAIEKLNEFQQQADTIPTAIVGYEEWSKV